MKEWGTDEDEPTGLAMRVEFVVLLVVQLTGFAAIVAWLLS